MKTPQPSLRGRAIKLLARREHSRAELAKKLDRVLARESNDDGDDAAPSHGDLDQVLDQLEQCGLLSDARAAEAYVRGHAARFGTAKLAHSLRARGIDATLIEASLAQEGIADEMTRAAAVWRGKFSGRPRDAREWAKQARFLQGRGFSGEVIRKLLKDVEDMPGASEEHYE